MVGKNVLVKSERKIEIILGIGPIMHPLEILDLLNLPQESDRRQKKRLTDPMLPIIHRWKQLCKIEFETNLDDG